MIMVLNSYVFFQSEQFKFFSPHNLTFRCQWQIPYVIFSIFKGFGVGDSCREDFDGDSVLNFEDSCPENVEFSDVDFRQFQSVNLDPKEEVQIDPVWRIRNKVGNVYTGVGLKEEQLENDISKQYINKVSLV